MFKLLRPGPGPGWHHGMTLRLRLAASTETVPTVTPSHSAVMNGRGRGRRTSSQVKVQVPGPLPQPRRPRCPALALRPLNLAKLPVHLPLLDFSLAGRTTCSLTRLPHADSRARAGDRAAVTTRDRHGEAHGLQVSGSTRFQVAKIKLNPSPASAAAQFSCGDSGHSPGSRRAAGRRAART
jgi:hypothetical protein